MATLLGLVYCLTGLSLLLGVGAVAGVALYILKRKSGPALPSLLDVSLTDKAWLCLWCLQLGFWIGHIVSSGLWHFPTDWDTLNYHLPQINHWLQARSLNTTAGGRWTDPGNNEILALWATGAFSGDFLAILNNLGPTILLGCSAVGFGLCIGLPKSIAHLTAIALITNYVVLKQLLDNMNDVAVAACFFAALFYIFRFVRSPLPLNHEETAHAEFGLFRRLRYTEPDLYLAGVSLGLLGGVKFYASGYALLAFAALIFLAAVIRGRRAAYTALMIGSLGLLLSGGYWYIRNFIITGSPFYPKDFFTAHDTLSKIYPEVWASAFFGNDSPELLSLFIKAIWEMTGPCELVGFMALPLTFLWLLVSAAWFWCQKKDAYSSGTRFTLGVLLVGSGLLLGITPFALESVPGTLNQLRLNYCPVRYGLIFLDLSLIGVIFISTDMISLITKALNILPRHFGWNLALPLSRCFLALFALLLAAVILFQVYRRESLHVDYRLYTGIAVVLLLLNILLLLIPRTWPSLRRFFAITLLIVFLAGTSRLIFKLAGHWHDGFQDFYITSWRLNRLASLKEQGNNNPVICALMDRYYPFFGSRRQHRVFQPIYTFSGTWFYEYLVENQVNVIIQPQQPDANSKSGCEGLQDCLGRFPDEFRLLRNINTRSVYLFVPSKDH